MYYNIYLMLYKSSLFHKKNKNKKIFLFSETAGDFFRGAYRGPGGFCVSSPIGSYIFSLFFFFGASPSGGTNSMRHSQRIRARHTSGTAHQRQAIHSDRQHPQRRPRAGAGFAIKQSDWHRLRRH